MTDAEAVLNPSEHSAWFELLRQLLSASVTRRPRISGGSVALAEPRGDRLDFHAQNCD